MLLKGALHTRKRSAILLPPGNTALTATDRTRSARRSVLRGSKRRWLHGDESPPRSRLWSYF